MAYAAEEKCLYQSPGSHDGPTIKPAPAFTQAHLIIRAALDAYRWPRCIKYEVFLHGSYKNDANVGGDSEVGMADDPTAIVAKTPDYATPAGMASTGRLTLAAGYA